MIIFKVKRNIRFGRGVTLFTQSRKNEKRIGSNISLQPAPPCPGFPGREVLPSPPPPWDQGSRARLQGNAATNPFHSSEIEWAKVMPSFGKTLDSI